MLPIRNYTAKFLKVIHYWGGKALNSLISPGVTEMNLWREQLFVAVFGTATLIGLISLVQSTIFAIRTGDWLNAVFYITCYGGSLFAILNRRIPFRIRAMITSTVFYLLGAFSAVMVGPVGSGRVYLFAFGILVSLLFGLRAGLIAVAINLFTLIAVAWLYAQGFLTWDGLNEYYNLGVYTTTTVTFMMLSTVVIIPVAILVSTVERSYRKLQVTSQQLQEEINQRTQTENALSESRERLELALQAAELGLWDWNISTGETIFNERWAQMLGFQLDDINQNLQTWSGRIHPDDRSNVMNVLNDHLEGNTAIYQCEHRLRTRTGDYRWILDMGKVVERDAQGKPLRAVGIHMDTHENKQIQELLFTSQKLADLGTLAAGIAHEINSPLQVITGLSERFLRKHEQQPDSDEQLTTDIQNISRNAWRIAAIIRSLLTFARSTPFEKEPEDLNQIIKDTQLLIEHQLLSWSSIRIITDLAEDLPPLQCSRNDLTQVLINLLNNAADAMPDGGEITIRTAYDQSRKQLILKIIDTGTGIPASIRERIFDPFFTTKPVGKGTGLGLSVTHSIVQNHHGQISVDSLVNEGSTFTIRLPETQPDLPETNTQYENGRFGS